MKINAISNLKNLALTLSIVCSAPTMAANVTLYLSGTWTQPNNSGNFTAELTYDAATKFYESNGGTQYMAGDSYLGILPSNGSLSVHMGDVTATERLTAIAVYKNATMGTAGDQTYYNYVGFGTDYYSFEISTYYHQAPLVWNKEPTPTTASGFPAMTDLLPTPANPMLWQYDGGYINAAYLSRGWGGIFFNIDSYSFIPPAAVPIPAAAWLFGTGIAGLAGAVRRRNRKS